MHIINDRTPGKLIIVTAGAPGIQGKGMTILTLNFTVVIEIPEAQLMGGVTISRRSKKRRPRGAGREGHDPS